MGRITITMEMGLKNSSRTDRKQGVLMRTKENISELLQEKLRTYFNGELTKNELGNWAKAEYQKILQGDYIIIDKLKVYIFIKNISNVQIVPNDIKDEYPCPEEEVRRIYDILLGKYNFRSILKLRIPQWLFGMYENVQCNLSWGLAKERFEIMTQVRGVIVDCIQKKHVSIRGIDLLHDYIDSNVKCSGTLIDLFDSYAIELLRYYCEFDGNSIVFKQSQGLYISRNDFSKDNAAEDILNILDYATGNASFKLCVGYENGVADFTIL